MLIYKHIASSFYGLEQPNCFNTTASKRCVLSPKYSTSDLYIFQCTTQVTFSNMLYLLIGVCWWLWKGIGHGIRNRKKTGEINKTKIKSACVHIKFSKPWPVNSNIPPNNDPTGAMLSHYTGVYSTNINQLNFWYPKPNKN